MTDELKTLKDIWKDSPVLEPFKEAVKEEAIKWVKDCPHCKFVKYKQQDNDEPIKQLSAREICFSCIKWMTFFNITEEDLENAE